MRKSFLLFLFIGISLFISCESQDDILEIQENVSSIYKTTINNYLTKIKIVAASNIENTKKINTLIESIDYKNVRLYDFQSPKKMLVVNLNNSSDFSGEIQSKIIFFLLNEEIIGSRLVTINNNSSTSFNEKTIISAFKKDTYISGYSGTITFFNLFQRMLLSNQYMNGDLVTIKAIEKNATSMISKSVLCIDWYLVTTYQNGYKTYEYQYTTCDSCSLDEIFESLCNSDDGTGGSGGIDASQEIEDQIDDSKLDPCLKAIMKQLKNTSNNDIAEILKKLGANSIYTVDMVMGTMKKPGDFAETIPISKNNYLITVTKDNYTSATNLFKATGLLHEIIHAYMLSVVDDFSSYPTNAPFDNFPELFKIYVNKTNNVNNAIYAQHEDMADKYVEAIASAIEGYQAANTGIPYSLADKQVFLDLAWFGLRGTDVYDKKFPTDGVDDKRIMARIGAEQSNGNIAIGKSCN